MTSAIEIFHSSLNNLSYVSGFGNIIEETHRNTPSDLAGQWAMRIVAKMLGHSRTIGSIATSGNFDHSAIISCSRLIMECATTITYLHENVDHDEWAFRQLILDLNNITSRIKFIRAFESKSSQNELRSEMQSIISKIKEHPKYTNSSEDAKKRYTSGQTMFVNGMRNAARTGMRWNEERFDAIYSYFSTHTHTTPMSFVRMRRHQVDFMNPSDFQYSVASFAIDVATICVRRSIISVVRRYPEYIDDAWNFDQFCTQDNDEALTKTS